MTEKEQKINFDTRNYRVHGDKNKRIIKNSLENNGAGRSILVDNENNIIAGNGVYEQWEGKPIKIVETDGNELIVVKRKDISPDDPRKKNLAIVDNSASDLSEFDYILLKEDLKDCDINEISDLGLDFDKILSEIDDRIKTEVRDNFSDEFNSYNDANCEMPIVPDFMENHECFVIITHNTLDELFIRNLFGISEVCFKNENGLSNRVTNVLTAEMIRERLCQLK
jgi:hypothetical protein